MEVLESRIHSFTKAKSSSKALSWPHPDSFLATPETLADAGFYYNPSKDDPDNVTCFQCGKELGGWDDDDDPFQIHAKKCPKCPWVLVRCNPKLDNEGDGEFLVSDPTRLPTHKDLEKARLLTYGSKNKMWPHDSKRTHGATSKKMAKAGFVYTPQQIGDDTATCFYCDLALSGWDEDDDPDAEHRKREARSGKPCPFYHTKMAPPPSQLKKSASQTRKTPASKTRSTIDAEVASAISALTDLTQSSSQTDSTNASAAPSRRKPPSRTNTDDGTDGEKTLKTSKSSRSLRGKRATRGKGRATRTTIPEEDENADEDVAVEDAAEEVVPEPEPVPEPVKTKKGKGRPTKAQKEEEAGSKDADPVEPTKTKQETKASVSKAKDDDAIIADEEPEPIKKARATKTKKEKPKSVATQKAQKELVSSQEDSFVIVPSVEKAKPPSPVSNRMTSSMKPLERVKKTKVEEQSRTVDERPEPVAQQVQPQEKKSVEKAVNGTQSPTRNRSPLRQVQPLAKAELNNRPIEKADEVQVAVTKTQLPLQDPRSLFDDVLESTTTAEPMNIDPLPSPPRPSPSPPLKPLRFEEEPVAPSYILPLAKFPMENISALSEEERAMTVEQYIRHEMARQYEQLKRDGERRIEAFKEEAREMRRKIEAL